MGSIHMNEIKQLDHDLTELADSHNAMLGLNLNILYIERPNRLSNIVLRGIVAEKAHQDITRHIRDLMDEKVKRLNDAGIRASVIDYLKKQ